MRVSRRTASLVIVSSAATLFGGCATRSAGATGDYPTMTPLAGPPTSTPEAARPTTTATGSAVARRSPSAGTRNAGETDEVKVYLVRLGQGPGPVGCGDTLVPVTRKVAPTRAPLTAAISELLSIKEQRVGSTGLYNALYQSDLQVERISIDNGTATIRLTGQLLLGGECDDPRIEAQLSATARQFASVKNVVILINGVPLKKIISLR